LEELVLDPKDDKLLEEDFGAANDIKRSQRHAKVISWCQRHITCFYRHQRRGEIS
jgi:hypothetical protein